MTGTPTSGSGRGHAHRPPARAKPEGNTKRRPRIPLTSPEAGSPSIQVPVCPFRKHPSKQTNSIRKSFLILSENHFKNNYFGGGPNNKTKRLTRPSSSQRPPSGPMSSSTDAERVCIVCLDSDPPPIQSGCACRSDSGLAHVDCLIAKAVSQQAHRGNKMRTECQTCGQ